MIVAATVVVVVVLEEKKKKNEVRWKSRMKEGKKKIGNKGKKRGMPERIGEDKIKKSVQVCI